MPIAFFHFFSRFSCIFAHKPYQNANPTLKPIFHCNAKSLASGVGVGQYPQRQTFALGIPPCRYLGANANPSPPPQNLKFVLALTQSPNASQWNIGCVGSPMQKSCVGHVHFMFFVLISFAFGTQHKPSFAVEYGL